MTPDESRPKLEQRSPLAVADAVSVIIPAKNEEAGLCSLIPDVQRCLPGAELIVVDDGSTDGTAAVSRRFGVRVISHPVSLGNGAAIKAGARAASGAVFVMLDADGQHRPSDIPALLDKLDDGYAMAVGARGYGGQAGVHRAIANRAYNLFSSWMVGHRVLDLTSGLRAVKSGMFKEFLSLLPNGFSYPTTITMAFFRAGYPVAYVPVDVQRRLGKSHLRVWRDGMRFLLIIFKIGTLYSPLKLFTPISALFFLLGLGFYAFTFWTTGRFTNMSALLLSTSVIIFLIGLVSEQITALIYRDTSGGKD